MIIKAKYDKSISQPEDITRILVNILKAEDKTDQNKEHFWVIGLNVRNIIKYIELVSLGILDANLIHPRETFRFAIMKLAKNIIVAHNHPSGSLEPSKEDNILAKRLVRSGEILGIPVLDNLIINTDGEHYSIK